MAGLILKSPYIKAGGAGKYMRYIATRENVERLPDSRPPTKKQVELIGKLTKDFPVSMKLDEYTEYNKSSTRVKASAYISATLEANWDTAQRSDIYMKYIATRPRVEKLGTHGLFGDEDDVDLDEEVPPGPVDECDWREQNYIYTTFLDETVPLDERDEAVEQEQKYADEGEPSSQYVLGVLYCDGGLLMPDAVKARDWFTRSAQQGYVPAQYALGKLLLSDDPEVHDQATGTRWLQTATRNGSPYAAYELGKTYLKSGDKQQAESYFTQAAEGENSNAMYMLGKLLYDRDPERANHWLRFSAFYDNPYAQRALDQHTSPPSPPASLVCSTI